LDSRLSILFATSEMEGLAKTGGLADVAKALPLHLSEHGHDVRICMPYYKTLKKKDKTEWVADLQVPVAQHGQPGIRFSVRQLVFEKATVYLIDCPAFFDRDGLYDDGHHAYQDNGYRFLFFSMACLVTAKELGFCPDIIHCNDWHTALIPYLLRYQLTHESCFKHSKTVLTIHNAAYQGIFEKSQLGLAPAVANCGIDKVLEGHNSLNFLKCGVLFADKINGVSPSYASELLTPLGSHGMSHIFQERAGDLCGILNGADYKDWDPHTDPHLPVNYDADDLGGKAQCKQALQLQVGLPEKPVPLFGMICRLTEQKGFYMLLPALEQFLKHRIQVVLVGTGERSIARELERLATLYPDKLKFINAYNDELAHLVEAGADFFLMPSVFEPCGLNQIYSLSYGTLPIVRGVGGLKDTVIDYDSDPQQATGFIFSDPSDKDLLNMLRRVLLLYLEQPEEIEHLRQHAMQTRFDWVEASRQYEQLYRQALIGRVMP